MLTILTGNKNKFLDLQSALSPMEVELLGLELDEIQSLRPQVVIEHKLHQAHLQAPGKEFLIDDRSLSIEGLAGLPGTFVKWFLETVGVDGIYTMAKNSASMKAVARAWVGYCSAAGEYHYFLGEVEGTIVAPRGDLDYGWGPLFLPEGSKKTFGEMTKQEKAGWSHYGRALEKFTVFYKTQK